MCLHAIQGLARPARGACTSLPPRHLNDSCGPRDVTCRSRQQPSYKRDSSTHYIAPSRLSDPDCKTTDRPVQRSLASTSSGSPALLLPGLETSLQAAASSYSRRAVLLAGASSVLLLLPGGLAAPGCCAPAVARLLHSRRSDVPCCLTVRNRSPRLVEARWVNYDGDEEPYATILPGHLWTVGTFETHPWRFRDAHSGHLVCQYVAQRGERLIQLYDDPASLLDLDPGSRMTESNRSSSGVLGGGSDDSAFHRRQRRLRQRRQPEPYGRPQLQPDGDTVPDQVAASATPQQPLSQPFSQPSQQPPPPPPAAVPERPGLAGGFDGLGNPAGQYTAATLLSVAVLPREAQAVVVLGLGGFEHPLSLLVGVQEARNIVNAAGAARGRRPTLLATWVQTLQALGGTLERVVITRQVGGVFYARIVLSQTWTRGSGPGPAAGGSGGLVSVDARPSDAVALALEAGAEVFVSLPVAELVQQQYLDAERDLTDRLLSPPLPPSQQERGGDHQQPLPQQPGADEEGPSGRGLLAEGLLGGATRSA